MDIHKKDNLNHDKEKTMFAHALAGGTAGSNFRCGGGYGC